MQLLHENPQRRDQIQKFLILSLAGWSKAWIPGRMLLRLCVYTSQPRTVKSLFLLKPADLTGPPFVLAGFPHRAVRNVFFR